MLLGVSPRTQALQLRWRPEASFFRHRSDILRQLDAEGVAESFVWGEQAFAILIGKWGTLEVGFAGAVVRLVSPFADRSSVLRAIDIALGELKPRAIVVETVLAQCLLPIEMDAGDAQQRAARRVAAGLSTAATPLDYAVLLDGHSDRLNCHFKVEWGVVRTSEVADRLRWRSGRLRSIIPQGIAPPVEADLTDLPAAAIFCDWFWPLHAVLGDGPQCASAVAETWSECIATTEHLSRLLQEVEGLDDRYDREQEAEG
jgi:hypothetical protein